VERSSPIVTESELPASDVGSNSEPKIGMDHSKSPDQENSIEIQKSPIKSTKRKKPSFNLKRALKGNSNEDNHISIECYLEEGMNSKIKRKRSTSPIELIKSIKESFTRKSKEDSDEFGLSPMLKNYSKDTIQVKSLEQELSVSSHKEQLKNMVAKAKASSERKPPMLSPSLQKKTKCLEEDDFYQQRFKKKSSGNNDEREEAPSAETNGPTKQINQFKQTRRKSNDSFEIELRTKPSEFTNSDLLAKDLNFSKSNSPQSGFVYHSPEPRKGKLFKEMERAKNYEVNVNRRLDLNQADALPSSLNCTPHLNHINFKSNESSCTKLGTYLTNPDSGLKHEDMRISNDSFKTMTVKTLYSCSDNKITLMVRKKSFDKFFGEIELKEAFKAPYPLGKEEH
jgi:hypothetical protein